MSSPNLTGQVIGDTSGRLPALHHTLPVWEPNQPMRPRSTPQLIAGVLMFAAAFWLAFADTTFRKFEAMLATPITGLFTGNHGAVRSDDIVFFALGTRRAFGLQITNECTSALLLIPLLVMMGAFTIFSRVPLRRDLLALAAGGLLMMVVNIFRVAGIGFSTYHWGLDPGYKYSHVFVGSAFSLVGFVGAMLVALWVLVRTERMNQSPALDGSAPDPSADTAEPSQRPPGSHRAGSSSRAARRRRPRPGPDVVMPEERDRRASE
ncbi:MAG: exosortase/archaeosortase family protein [Pseudonocardiales bacterium]